MTKIGYAAMLEQFHPTDLLDYCAAAEDAGFDAGFMVSEHFHPWTPQQGQSAFAWAFMGALGTRTTLPFGTAVTCPGFPLPPGRDRPRGGDPRGDVPGPVLARPGRRRGAQRARHRRRVAGDRRPQRDDVRGDRDHQQAVQRGGRPPSRGALHAREREALHAPRGAGQDLRRDRRTGQRQADRQVRRRDDHGRGRRREDRDALGEVRRGRAGRPARTRPASRSSSRSTCHGHRPTTRRWTTPCASGRTAGWPFPSRTSRTPRTSRRWPSSSGPEHFTNRCEVSSDLAAQTENIQHYVDMGFDEIHLHNVGRNQEEFIDVFGREVLPNLRLG